MICHEKQSTGLDRDAASIGAPSSKVLVIGPLPPPINGMTVATECAVRWLSKYFDVYVVNMLSESDLATKRRSPDCVGGGIWSRFVSRLCVLKQVWMSMYRIRPNLCYLTTSQSALGFLKDMGIVILATLFRVPVLGHLHGGYFGEFYRTSGVFLRLLIRVTMARFAGMIVLTEKLKDMFAGLVPPDRVYVVENFVADEVRPTESELTRRWGRFRGNPKEVRLLYLSNLIPSKGYLDVIHAVHELRRRGKNVACDLAGAWLSEDDKGTAEELVRYYDLQGIINFHGVVKGEQKRRLLEHADIFVLPTYYPFEGVPLSMLEAMAWGLPVVVTNHGGIGDVVRDKINGVFVQPQMPGEIADAVCWLTFDIDRYYSIATANSRLVMERFTESRSAQSLVSVINKLLE